jgi:hypothetical protein
MATPFPRVPGHWRRALLLALVLLAAMLTFGRLMKIP